MSLSSLILTVLLLLPNLGSVENVVLSGNTAYAACKRQHFLKCVIHMVFKQKFQVLLFYKWLFFIAHLKCQSVGLSITVRSEM